MGWYFTLLRYSSSDFCNRDSKTFLSPSFFSSAAFTVRRYCGFVQNSSVEKYEVVEACYFLLYSSWFCLSDFCVLTAISVYINIHKLSHTWHTLSPAGGPKTLFQTWRKHKQVQVINDDNHPFSKCPKLQYIYTIYFHLENTFQIQRIHWRLFGY